MKTQTSLDYRLPVYRVQLVRESTQRIEDRELINSPAAAAKVFADYLEGADRENFVIMLVDTKTRVIGLHNHWC